MRRLLTILLAISVISCSGGGEDPEPDIPAKAGYRLVWNDEFEGTNIDGSNWNWEVHGHPANNELQYYTREERNSRVEDGILIIEAYKEEYTGPDGTRQYTSARINSRKRADFLYGRFEIRARMPLGQGIWPAIWMMPTDSEYGGWPRSGEIDIMELLGHDPRTVYQTLHYTNADSDNHASQGRSYKLPSGSGTFAQDFHVFALEWDETEMRWYVDDLQVARITDWHTKAAPFPAPFDRSFYFILNVAVGGDWPGSPNATTPFPQHMAVDYVRAFERIPE